METNTAASGMSGKIGIRRSYDVRIDPKTGQKSEVSPATCMCCQRSIFRVSELVNGDLVGSECDGLIAYPVYRIGRTLNRKQAAYATSRGLL
jgi:ribosomal protein L37AE/L43A